MKYIYGNILTKNGLINGYISYKNNKIVEIRKGNPPKKPYLKGLIIPNLINMHTHIGDSFIKEKKNKIT